MKKILLFIVVLVGVWACSNTQSLNGTKWLSIDTMGEDTIMGKDVEFGIETYVLTIINYASLSSDIDTTYVTGKYVYNPPDVIFYYDSISGRYDRAVVNDSLLLLSGEVDTKNEALIFKKK